MRNISIKMRIAALALLLILSRASWSAICDTPRSFDEIYVVENFGHVLKLNSKFETLHKVDFDGFMRLRDILTAELSTDGKHLILGAQYSGIHCVSTDSWNEEDLAPSFPAIPEQNTQSHGPVLVLCPRSPFFYIKDVSYRVHRPKNPKDASYGVWPTHTIDDSRSNFLLDIAQRALTPLTALDLPTTDRIRISPQGDKMLLVNDPILLVDSATGHVEKSLNTGEAKRQQLLGVPGWTFLRGLDINWNTLELDIWRTFCHEKNRLVEERVIGNMNTGQIKEAVGPSIWPNKRLDPRRDPETGREIKGGIPSGILAKLHGISGHLGNVAYPHVLVRSWEARILSQLKPEWFKDMADTYIGYTEITPDAKHLILAVAPPAPSPEAPPEEPHGERSLLIIMDVQTGEIVKRIDTPQRCVAILFR